MPRAPGRDQRPAMERLVRLLGALKGAERGLTTDQVLRAVMVDGESDDAQRKKLQRDIHDLNALGFDIRNTAPTGTDAVYVMRARDNRLQVHLTPEQRGELLRAAIAAGIEGMGAHLGTEEPARSRPPSSEVLDLVQRGVTRHCLIRFAYKGNSRVVHPVRLHSGPAGWYLGGSEEGQDVVKEFVVSRMSDVSLSPPGTAAVVEAATRPSLDPLTWLQDPPTDVVIEVPVEHRALVENLLGSAAETPVVGDTLRMRYVVTNRAVFRWRIYELGTRVHVTGPDDVRREMLAELESFMVDG